jgi:hypothetical protein
MAADLIACNGNHQRTRNTGPGGMPTISANRADRKVLQFKKAHLDHARAADRLRSFRVERVAKIVGGKTPVPLTPGGKILIHLLPLAAFMGGCAINLGFPWSNPRLLRDVLGTHGWPLFNADGLFLAARLKPATRYAQIFRNGCIEVVADWSDQANKDMILPGSTFEMAVIERVHFGKHLFQAIGMLPPIVVTLTFVGMKGWRISTPTDFSNSTFRCDPVFIPELVLETFDGIVEHLTRPLLDAVWNAAGSLASPNYKDEGRRLT